MQDFLPNGQMLKKILPNSTSSDKIVKITSVDKHTMTMLSFHQSVTWNNVFGCQTLFFGLVLRHHSLVFTHCSITNVPWFEKLLLMLLLDTKMACDKKIDFFSTFTNHHNSWSMEDAKKIKWKNWTSFDCGSSSVHVFDSFDIFDG